MQTDFRVADNQIAASQNQAQLAAPERFGARAVIISRTVVILTRCSSKSRSADSSRLSVSPCTSRRSSASMRATARSNSARVSITFGSAAESSLPYLVRQNDLAREQSSLAGQ